MALRTTTGFHRWALGATERRKAGGLSVSGVTTFTQGVAHDAKIELRRNALAHVGADRAHVFDAFAGPGEMYRAVWKDAASYVGCDSTWFADERTMYVADSRVVLRSLDLSAFNVFDLDHFGCPWEWAWIIAKRRRVAAGERVAITLTDGSALRAKMGQLAAPLKFLTGLPKKMPKMQRLLADAHRLAAKRIADELCCAISGAWYAEQRGQMNMRYIALAMTGKET